MKRFVEGEDRTQSTLFPERLGDYISEDNPVRVIEAFVDELDLKVLGFEGIEPRTTGRPAYHPLTLLKLYIYGYLNRIQSSRRLERESQRNVEVMWLTRRQPHDMKHARLTHLTSEEYLASENDSPTKHEYVAGQLYAMVGVRDTHNAIALNVASQLRSTLRGGPCRVFMSDVKVRVEEADAFYYPDVFVTCDARDTDPYVKRYPSLVIEVLSPSTEAIDRREKLLNYRKLPSLHEYVLIGSEQRWIEIYRLEADGSWTVATLEGDENLELSSVGTAIPAGEIYQDVTF